ncbi:MAG: (Fe-S)-binding protein [Planctomycetes bacterium]|nr:(Fe-S)-binding protein [Planctomycetota bacterium]
MFGNIPPAAKAVFYILATAALACFAYGVYRRARLWRLGRPSNEPTSLAKSALALVRDVLLQSRLRDSRIPGRTLATSAHLLLFSGFVVLTIGTMLIAVEHVLASLLGREAGDAVFHKGLYYAVFEVTLDAFGLALLAGCGLLALRRWRMPGSIAQRSLDWGVLAALVMIGLSGYATEGARIIREATVRPEFSFVGLAVARSLQAASVDQAGAVTLHFVLWWLHAVLALGLIAAAPYTRLLHAIAGAKNLATKQRPLGTMSLVSMEQVEQTGLVGVGQIEHFTRVQLLQLDACVSCGRCQDVCPAHQAGKPLSPRDVVQDVRGVMNLYGTEDLPELVGDVVSHETLWSCTTCSACVDVCPLGVNPLEMITDMRRFAIGEGALRGPAAAALQKTQRSGNPWGLPPQDRFAWAKGLGVPTVAENPQFDVLYWVGCAAAYDRRAGKVARSVVRLLQIAEVNFAVLGPEERCTGESARRMGEEFLFQEAAAANVEVLGAAGVKKILTHCPHCLNSFRSDYPQMGGRYEVVHHSEFLAELIAEGRLKIDGEAQKKLALGRVTYHDPCYLARVQNVTAPPRDLLQQTIGGSGELVEMPRHGRATACCGAGGGRMWFDDTPDQRIGVGRIEEVLATGAKTVAVACPFCLTMVSDGVAAADSHVAVRDIAELLIEVIDAG